MNAGIARRACGHFGIQLRDSSPDSSPEDQASDLPDWLRSLRGPEDQESLPFPPEREAQSALPDWLSQLRDQPGLAEELQAEDISERSG